MLAYYKPISKLRETLVKSVHIAQTKKEHQYKVLY